MLDGEVLLWHSPITSPSRIAVPRFMIPGVMALVHTTYAHPGVRPTTWPIQRKFYWPTYKRDVRDYVLSCGCNRRKKSASQQVAMLPAHFLQLLQVLETDTQDLAIKSSAGNRYLLLVVDRASKFAFAYLSRTKDAESVAKKLLDLVLMFSFPRSTRTDLGAEFTAEVVQHIFRSLKVPIDYGPVDLARALRAVERLRGWIHEAVTKVANPGPSSATCARNRQPSCNARRLCPCCRAAPPPLGCCLDKK